MKRVTRLGGFTLRTSPKRRSWDNNVKYSPTQTVAVVVTEAVMVQYAVTFASNVCQSAQDSSSAQACKAFDLVCYMGCSYMRLGHDPRKVMGARVLTPCLCIQDVLSYKPERPYC